MFRSGLAGVFITLWVPGVALGQGQVTILDELGRTSASQKGSLLVYPKVEIRWNARHQLVQDTFLTLDNDLNADVDIEMYLICETGPLVNNTFTLTQNEAAYWSACTGDPMSLSPWTVLEEPYPDPEGSDDLVLRGHLLLWAIDMEYHEIRWNHLYGGATLVNYRDGSAWEYTAYAFPVVDPSVANGQQSGTPGVLNLDGEEYALGLSNLLLDFFASGSVGLSSDQYGVMVDTDLTLLVLSHDLRQEGTGPLATKASFDIWNANEVRFSGMEHCVYAWDQTLLGLLGGHFLRQNLHTDKGCARITGLASSLCEESTDEALLGVGAKMLFAGPEEISMSGTNLAGSGELAAVIKYDPQELSPEKTDRDETGDAGGSGAGRQGER